MKRKRRNPDENQNECCGVWLDTSALKRCKIQNLMGKPRLRILTRLPSYSPPSKAPLPCTKQTTISTFVRAQQTGEREINTNGELLAAASNSASHLKDHEWPAGEPTPLPDSLIQAGVTQECKQHIAEKPQLISPWNLAPTEAQRNSCVVGYAKGKKSAAQSGDPLSVNFSQHQEEKGTPVKINSFVLTEPPLTMNLHKSFTQQETLSKLPLREKNDGWEKEKTSTSASQSSPNPKAVSYKTKDRRKYNPTSFVESSDSENIDPQLEKSMTTIRPMKNVSKITPGFSLESNYEISNYKYGNSEDATRPLFTQDSDGHKVISHRRFREPSQLSFQRKSQRGKSGSGESQSPKDRFGACYSVEKRPHIPVVANISQQPCYDLLFTEDSEGNKVIKH
ncbi:aurora kinase A- and ninein-interacting protein [Anolis carolinensis]|uniref:aurora kinase A- and ninein-interacting protein n=1 Tax=Anolis carolinensis TaxID=28377 RepID=UPI002F2B7441